MFSAISIPLCCIQLPIVENEKEAKQVIENYIKTDMQKYAPDKSLDFSKVIKADCEFFEYAQNKVLLTQNRHKAFDELKLDSIDHKIDFLSYKFENGIYTIGIRVN